MPIRKPLAEDRPIYERQSGESAPAWEAADIYIRIMSPMERSLTTLARRLGKSRALMDRWSSRWSWVDRSRAWDNEQDRRRRDAQLAEAVQAGRRQARAAELVMQTLIRPHAALLRWLQQNPTGFERLIEEDPWRAMAMIVACARALPAVFAMERLARGEPTQIISEPPPEEDPRQLARLILEDPEAARAAEELLARLHGVQPARQLALVRPSGSGGPTSAGERRDPAAT